MGTDLNDLSLLFVFRTPDCRWYLRGCFSSFDKIGVVDLEDDDDADNDIEAIVIATFIRYVQKN